MTEHLDGFVYYQQLYSNMTERPVLYGMLEAYEEDDRHVRLQYSTQVFRRFLNFKKSQCTKVLR